MARKRLAGVYDTLLGQSTSYQEPQGEGEMLVTPKLDQLIPDPNQPRHVVPDDLRERLLVGDPPGEVLWEAWRRCLGEELYGTMRSHDLSPAEALAKRREKGPLDLALQLTLEGLVELADSIVRHGLRQPINVYDMGGGKYRVAEGERRWWAHVYLYTVRLHYEAETILARVQPLPDGDLEVLARQHAENAHRADLSAVARARAIRQVREAVQSECFQGTASSQEMPGAQPFSLLQDLSGTASSQEILPQRGRPQIQISEHDLDEHTGQRLVELTGKGMGGRMVRHYLTLLTLPPDAQALAEAATLSEWALRPVASLTDPERQIRLVHALASGEMTPAQVAAEVKRLKQKGRQEKSSVAHTLTRFRSSLRFAAADDLPDPAALAAEAVQWSPKKQSETLDWACRYAAFLNAFLEKAKEELQ